MQYHEIVVDDDHDMACNIIEVSLDEGDDILTIHAGDLYHEVDVRVSVTEALALIEVLSVAVRHAMTNRDDEDPS